MINVEGNSSSVRSSAANHQNSTCLPSAGNFLYYIWIGKRPKSQSFLDLYVRIREQQRNGGLLRLFSIGSDHFSTVGFCGNIEGIVEHLRLMIDSMLIFLLPRLLLFAVRRGYRSNSSDCELRRSNCPAVARRIITVVRRTKRIMRRRVGQEEDG